MAEAAAPAARTRAAVPELGPMVVGFTSAATMGALAAADGGYYPPAWGWTALVGLWVAAAWLLLDRVELRGVLDVVFLGAFAGLAAWTWLSLLWTENTVQTVQEGFRLLAYLGVAAALLLVVRRETAPALLRGVFAAIALVSAYGLGTRLFPDRLGGTFDPIATYRLSEPLGYWNGLGIFAAMGALLAIGIVARDSSMAARLLAAAAFPVLLCTTFFTFSRGAWVGLGIGLLAAFALDPRRLQYAVATIAIGVPAALAVWASSSSEALTKRDSALFAAVEQGQTLAFILLFCAALAALAAAGLMVAERRISVSRSMRLAFAMLLAVLAVGVAGTVLVRFGGPVDLVERAYDAFNEPPAADPENLEERLFTFSGSYRPDLWEAAWEDYRANPALGSGAGTFEQFWNRTRPTTHIVRDAHNVYLETMAELGLLGILLLVVAFGTPLVAAVRARGEPLAVAAVGAYAAYLFHAAIDWDWELLGLTVPAIACGVVLLALRSPRTEPLVPGSAIRFASAAVLIALAGLAFVGLVGASASSASEEAATSSPPDFAEAEDQARKARRWAPWSSEPWQLLGEAQLAEGDLSGARASFRKAIAKERSDWELWFRLAEASNGSEQRRALAEARRLNPRSLEIATFTATEP